MIDSEDVTTETSDFRENMKLKSAFVNLSPFKPHYCSKCDKYYWSQDILEHHLKMNHECYLCRNSFPQAWILKTILKLFMKE